MVKKMKDIVKKNPVSNPTFGTDPSNPWATKYNVTEASEEELLGRYLNSRGVNPKFVTRDTKIAHAKSTEYAKWKSDHIERFAREETQIKENDTSEKNEMSQAQLHFIKYACEEILEYIDKGGEVEEWYQVKIAKSFSEFESLHSFMEGEARRLGIKEESEQLDELAPKTLASYVLKTTSKDPKRAEPRKKAMNKLAKAMAKQPVDPKAPKYLPMGEAKTIQGTALDKFRQAAAERARKHDDIEREMKARHAAGKEDMKGSIDRLEKHLNKEESEQVNEMDTYPHPDSKEGKKLLKSFKRSAKTDPTDLNAPGKSPTVKQTTSALLPMLNKSFKKSMKKEEVEQIDEISKSTLSSYKDKSTASMKNAQSNRDAAEPGKNMSKGFADLHAKSDAIVKKRVKGLIGYMQRKQGMKPMGEDAFQDSQAATQMPFDGANTTNDTDMMKRREATKSARIIKSIYKRKNMKEELNDWEKEDKSVQSYGKKPKLDMTDKKDNVGENKPEARAVMAGGKTLTGQPRDMVEIDPAMKNRPDRPDTFDKGNPKKSPA
jgi:hypothetical protein